MAFRQASKSFLSTFCGLAMTLLGFVQWTIYFLNVSSSDSMRILGLSFDNVAVSFVKEDSQQITN